MAVQLNPLSAAPYRIAAQDAPKAHSNAAQGADARLRRFFMLTFLPGGWALINTAIIP